MSKSAKQAQREIDDLRAEMTAIVADLRESTKNLRAVLACLGMSTYDDAGVLERTAGERKALLDETKERLQPFTRGGSLRAVPNA